MHEIVAMLLTLLAGGGLVVLAWRRTALSAHAEVREALAGGALLVDVRQPHEFAEHHVDGAINVPLHRLAPFADQCGGAELVVYSGGGQRSFRAARLLRKLNRVAVYDVGAMRNVRRYRLDEAMMARPGRPAAGPPPFRPLLAPRARWASPIDA